MIPCAAWREFQKLTSRRVGALWASCSSGRSAASRLRKIELLFSIASVMRYLPRMSLLPFEAPPRTGLDVPCRSELTWAIGHKSRGCWIVWKPVRPPVAVRQIRSATKEPLTCPIFGEAKPSRTRIRPIVPGRACQSSHLPLGFPMVMKHWLGRRH